jgi:hypothetical protein
MRIRVKTDDGKNFNIILPMWLVKIGLSKFVIKMIKKKTPKESQKHLDEINFPEIAKSLNELKAYKGLTIVDIKDKDGTEVTITV